MVKMMCFLQIKEHLTDHDNCLTVGCKKKNKLGNHKEKNKQMESIDKKHLFLMRNLLCLPDCLN